MTSPIKPATRADVDRVMKYSPSSDPTRRYAATLETWEPVMVELALQSCENRQPRLTINGERIGPWSDCGLCRPDRARKLMEQWNG